MKIDLCLIFGDKKQYTLLIADVEVENRFVIGDKIESRAFWNYCDEIFQQWFNNLYLFTVIDVRFTTNFKMSVICEGDTKLYDIKEKQNDVTYFTYILEKGVSKCLNK